VGVHIKQSEGQSEQNCSLPIAHDFCPGRKLIHLTRNDRRPTPYLKI
jgi:hypothetical protein